ncbi:hypothetical protein N9Y26_00615 [bacterium]|nr:hypothetical protein [bacterium]
MLLASARFWDSFLGSLALAFALLNLLNGLYFTPLSHRFQDKFLVRLENRYSRILNWALQGHRYTPSAPKENEKFDGMKQYPQMSFLSHDLASNELDHFRGKHIGMVFQRPHFVRNISIMDNLLLSLYLSKNKEDKQDMGINKYQ